MKRWLVLVLLAWVLAGCAPPCSQDPACTRVLFIGNSYTYMNDLPKVFTKLAESGGRRVETGLAAQGGWTFDDHVNSGETLEQITASRWNYIVLQEQSQIPASEAIRTVRMYPAARSLVAKIRQAGAQPVLFVTWAHGDGWPENGFYGYESMQLNINSGYLNIARELKVPLAPVGYAWLAWWRQASQPELWQEDGSHPNQQGTYLAACVFYATLFQQSPDGLSYTGSLSNAEAQALQKIAGETVLKNRAKWNLPKPTPEK